jgi:predicted nucleic acid-binding protein
VKYFFDTNVISKLVKNDPEAMVKIREITEEEEPEFYINRLVKLESLRAIPLTHKKLYTKTEDTLNLFRELEIKPDIYNEAISFARYCKSKGLSFGKCEAIDYLHFITAKYYDLTLISFDNDMKKLEEKYALYKEENK